MESLSPAVILIPAIAYTLQALLRLTVFAVALHGTKPKERPDIIRAVAECFRVWPRRGT